MKRLKRNFCILLTLLCMLFSGCGNGSVDIAVASPNNSISLSTIPAYSGDAFVTLNNNVPNFMETDLTNKSFESYSELDSLGRCQVAFANVGQDIMPTEERGSIGQVKPSGWQSVKYDHIDGKYLYNRCHLIGFQLTGENANKGNLITGTRYLNIEGMLPFENMVADYVKETDNHVLYRVTPVFEGDNLVASGVQIEAMSVEDAGESILFNVYCYNVQPGVSIDYSTGESTAANSSASSAPSAKKTKYVLNINNKKFHLPDCSSATSMKEENKKNATTTRDQLIKDGYEPCGKCKP